MKVFIYPFFSQQNKLTKKFQLTEDSSVRTYVYIARRLLARGWDVVMVLPPPGQCQDLGPVGVPVLRVPYWVAVDNLDRRLQWEPSFLRFLATADLVLTNNELIPYPLRCLAPDLPIVSECAFHPATAWPQTAPLFPLSWKAATYVNCVSEDLLHLVRQHNEESSVWSFSWDENIRAGLYPVRNIDVSFISRCSATNYSNHELFLEAQERTQWRTYIPDVTSFLRSKGVQVKGLTPSKPERAEFEMALKSSRVVVGMIDDGNGGHSFREAIACGACPVALRTPTYERLLTPDWPFFVEERTAAGLRRAVDKALVRTWNDVPVELHRTVVDNVEQTSYASAWRSMEGVIDRVTRR